MLVKKSVMGSLNPQHREIVYYEMVPPKHNKTSEAIPSQCCLYRYLFMPCPNTIQQQPFVHLQTSSWITNFLSLTEAKSSASSLSLPLSLSFNLLSKVLLLSRNLNSFMDHNAENQALLRRVFRLGHLSSITSHSKKRQLELLSSPLWVVGNKELKIRKINLQTPEPIVSSLQ